METINPAAQPKTRRASVIRGGGGGMARIDMRSGSVYLANVAFPEQTDKSRAAFLAVTVL